jgi:hypothetical protein
VKIAGDDSDAPQRAEQSEETRQKFAQEVLQILIDCGEIKLPEGATLKSQEGENARAEAETIESNPADPAHDEQTRDTAVGPQQIDTRRATSVRYIEASRPMIRNRCDLDLSRTSSCGSVTYLRKTELAQRNNQTKTVTGGLQRCQAQLLIS